MANFGFDRHIYLPSLRSISSMFGGDMSLGQVSSTSYV